MKNLKNVLTLGLALLLAPLMVPAGDMGLPETLPEDVKCKLIPGSERSDHPDMVCGTYRCPDGRVAYQCNLREIIIN